MIKRVKKFLFASISFLGISVIVWATLLLNPSLSYAHATSFDNVTVYHNNALEKNTEKVLKDAFSIIKKSEIYNKDIHIQFCLNDDKIYPHLHPLAGATAYSFSNKTVVFNSKAIFNSNRAEYTWEVNNNVTRNMNLTWLLAHEFTHNLQYNVDILSPIKYDNWKLEGYADYVSRSFIQDGKLLEKINKLTLEESTPKQGLPVFELEDGTVQILSYYKYALMTQYVIEEEGKNYKELIEDKRSYEEIKQSMMDWAANQSED